MSSEQSKARVIKANLNLQAKVGTGTISEEKVQTMQTALENNKIDFAPMAAQFLAQLEAAISAARIGEGDVKVLIKNMTEPVMQIKGNAAMFNYKMVSNLANVVLNFLENIEKIDSVVLDIVDAHHKTLNILIKNKMSGDGGAYGTQLESELRDACKRYFTKKVGAIPAADGYFVG
ncbi:hypothetical protein [Micavibrio aeruginosavorus]|uniref:Uncharacterized protein n=1 Tax=Micavibrio aeruginosavorus EPB TaxID=349215 RepID=M4VC03_9BACT|nr:hypothetical protein [Micavibrio aeruginosavorus]AGH96932.1 hypothetical protein A11S_95 [Micavibrio aeruginosavorus EPB]